MAVVNLQRIMDKVKGDKEMNGKLKGYIIYGRLAEYMLSDVEGIPEKSVGGGVYTIISMRIIKYIDKCGNPNSNILENYNSKDDGEVRVAETGGEALIYVSHEDFNKYAGKDVVVRLNKGTSLDLGYEYIDSPYNRARILTWDKSRKGIWIIKPTEIEDAQKEIGKSRDLDKYIRKYNQLDNIEDSDGEIDKGYIYVTSDNGQASPKVWWRGNGQVVSSTPIHLDVLRRSNDYRPKQTVTSTTKSERDEVLNTWNDNQQIIKEAESRQGKYRSCIIANTIKEDNRETAKMWTDEVITCYLKSCLKLWETGGKDEIFGLLEDMNNLTESKAKKRNIRGARLLLYKSMPLLPDICYARLKSKKHMMAMTWSAYAMFIIGHVAGIDLKRLDSNIRQIHEDKSRLTTEDCLYLMITNPYLLTMLGGGLRYADALKIESTIRCKTSEKNELEKRMLFLLDAYKDYTRDSHYRDMLLSKEEWVRRAKENTSHETMRNEKGSIYLKDVGMLETSKVIWRTPDSILHPRPLSERAYITPLHIPPIREEDYEYTNVLEELKNHGLICMKGRCYIPVYEAIMESDIIDRINRHKDRMRVIISMDNEKIQEYIARYEIKNPLIIADNLKGKNRITKLGYKEPSYFHSIKRKVKKNKELDHLVYIIGETSEYSIWELAYLLDNINESGYVIFCMDDRCHPAINGVSITGILKKLIKPVYIQSDDNKYKTNMIVYNQESLSESKATENIIYELREGLNSECTIRRLKTDDAMIERCVKLWRQHNNNPLIITTSKGMSEVINEEISMSLFQDKTTLIIAEDGTSYHINETMRYLGKSQPFRSRLKVERSDNQAGYIFTDTGKRGLMHGERMKLIGLLSLKKVYPEEHFEAPYARQDKCMVMQLDDGTFMLFNLLLKKGIYGKFQDKWEKGYTQDIHEITQKKEDTVILAVGYNSKFCRQDIYTVFAKASKEIILIGDVGAKKSSLGYAQEMIYPSQRRTFLK